MNIYMELTDRFNEGRGRAILAGGQAVVLHRLAIMSKDGDWLLREEPEALTHVLSVLAHYGARYRFGAPLDIRWMRGGWSAHFEFQKDGLRVRTDFVTRPPRLTQEDMARLWRNQASRMPFVGVRELIELKKTNREKDYAVIGELARRLNELDDKLLCSRSARDLITLVAENTARARQLAVRRSLLNVALNDDGLSALEAALDAERRDLIHRNERRLAAYTSAAERWAQAWAGLSSKIADMELLASHAILVEEAMKLLPATIPEERT